MFSIRAATGDDATAIAHVHVESWRTTYTGIVPDAYLAGLDEILRAKLWQEWLTGKTPVLVAELDGSVVGFAHGGVNREAKKVSDGELYSIYLLRDVQRQGVGTALLSRMASLLSGQGFKNMAVWVLEKNPSRSFYERSGARLIGSKVIEIGGARLMEVAYLWPEIEKLI